MSKQTNNFKGEDFQTFCRLIREYQDNEPAHVICGVDTDTRPCVILLFNDYEGNHDYEILTFSEAAVAEAAFTLINRFERERFAEEIRCAKCGG